MGWSSGSWTIGYSDSILSNDGLKIYSMLTYGSSKYLYFITLNNSDGQIINSRYKSSQIWSYVWGIALNGDYLAANIEASPGLIVLVYLPTQLIIVKNYAFTYPYGLWVEKSSRR